jgi:predicted RNase H-like nuclease (RuvC/YqgF family)
MNQEILVKYKNNLNHLHSQMAKNKHNVECIIKQKDLEISSLKKELTEKNFIIDYTNQLLIKKNNYIEDILLGDSSKNKYIDITKNNNIEELKKELEIAKTQLDYYRKLPVTRRADYDEDGNICNIINTFSIVEKIS